MYLYNYTMKIQDYFPIWDQLSDREKETIFKGLYLKESSIEEDTIYQAIDRYLYLSKTNKIAFLEKLKELDSYVSATAIYKLSQYLFLL